MNVYFANQFLPSVVVQEKIRINIRICGFSLPFISVNEESFGFFFESTLFGQKQKLNTSLFHIL